MADTTTPPVPIDYSSRDYAALRSDLITGIPDWIPEWTNRGESDFGIVLIEMFAYVGDILNYYIDRAANEAFISTAVQRASVLAHAQALDYRPTGLAAANATLSITSSPDAPGAVTVPAGTRVATLPAPGGDPIVFETDEDLILLPGTTDLVAASQGLTVSEDAAAPVAVSTGASDQVFSLYYGDIIDDTLSVFVDEDGAGAGQGVRWSFIPHLIDASSEDRVYSTTTDENGRTYLLFGDNVNGRVPTQGSIVTATYRVGLGTAGNVGANSIVEFMSPIVGITSVTNPSGASGGADVETIESIRKNAPRALTTLERAVTTSDYEVLAGKVPGVLHARAVATAYTSVLLHIAPVGGGAPSTALQNSVLNDLESKKMISTSITVAAPTYVPINVTVDPLHVLPEYSRTAVEMAVFNAVVAVFDIDEVNFGHRVTLSEVYRAIQEVEGVDYAVVTVLSLTASGLSQEILLADNEIPEVGTVTVTSSGGLINS